MGILDNRFDFIIAKKAGVNPNQVIGEYISQQRERHVYPTARYNCGVGLLSFTGNELEEIGEVIDAYMKVTC